MVKVQKYKKNRNYTKKREKIERQTGLEPATCGLGSRRSAN